MSGPVLAGHYDDLRDAAHEVAYLEGLAPWGDEPWRTVALALLDLAKRQDAEREATIDARVNAELESVENLGLQLADALERAAIWEKRARACAEHVPGDVPWR